MTKIREEIEKEINEFLSDIKPPYSHPQNRQDIENEYGITVANMNAAEYSAGFSTAKNILWNRRHLLVDLFRSWALETFKDYWFYAGEWHNANCPFIRYDQGVCTCDHDEIKKKIEEKQ